MGFFRKDKDKSEDFSPHKTAGKVVLLGVNEIGPNPAQPRQTFDLEALKGLSDSIRVNGVLQPVLVRKTDSGDQPYELISGERRLRASKLCGNETIPAVIMDSTARQSAVFAILENIQRRDLNLFEEAAALRTLVVEWGVTQEEAAAKLGMAQSTIANKMRLLALSPKEQRIILENGLSERHGRALLRLQAGESRELAAALIAEKHLTVRETEELVSRLLAGETLEDIFQPPKPAAPEPAPVPQPPVQIIAPVADKKVGRRKARKVLLVKDVRVFLNTVNQAIDAMKHAGIPAESEREDHEEYIEYRVRIPVQGKNQLAHAAKSG